MRDFASPDAKLMSNCLLVKWLGWLKHVETSNWKGFRGVIESIVVCSAVKLANTKTFVVYPILDITSIDWYS